jgi:hypothetical protein
MSAPVSSPGPEVGESSCRHLSDGGAPIAASQTKPVLLLRSLQELIRCGYAKTAGECNRQLWHPRHSLPRNTLAVGRLADSA